MSRVLDATVEIIKALVSAPNTGVSAVAMTLNKDNRKTLTDTIEAVYRKIEELETGNVPK